MTQPPKAKSKLADTSGLPQIGDRGAAVADIAIAYATDDPGITVDGTINIADGDATLVTAEMMIAIEELMAKVNAILAALRAQGLIAD